MCNYCIIMNTALSNRMGICPKYYNKLSSFNQSMYKYRCMLKENTRYTPGGGGGGPPLKGR